ncbi:MAG: HAMP domain-containing histidine kinase [Lachnospiraceae bacterium]|nr:HAMP domain-containing histidine kinase [Lachnospiraceae bacterium]
MRRSVFWSFIAGYLFFAIAGLLIITFTTTDSVFDSILSSHGRNAYTFAKDYATDISKHINDNDLEASVKDYFSALPNTASSVWVTDIYGNVLFTNAQYSKKSLAPFTLSAYNTQYYGKSNFFGYYPYDVLTAYSPIKVDNTTVGYTFFNMSYSAIQLETHVIIKHLYATYGLIILISFALLFIFFLYVYLPLKELRRAAFEYAKGNFSYDKLNVSSNDELGDLAASLLYMSHQLNETEEYQKTFISNISHDFRSPLTSIKGYIQAMLDGTIPPELQNKYLGIVLSESERLERLTSGLIDLNSWNTKAPGLVFEDFDIDAIISSVIDTFHGRCEKRHIVFDYTKGSNFVFADRSKIEQILYNLIDNAMKFSPDDSAISIKVYSKGEKYYCSIKDRGTGISKKDLAKIWDRFYKTDSSRGKDKTGSGIGLSIVREIINAHNQTIDVVSTEGVGTEFIFSLLKSNSKEAKYRKSHNVDQQYT